MPIEAPVETRRPTQRAIPDKLSYEEFLQWDGENQHVEWVDGEVVIMSPVSKIHSDAVEKSVGTRIRRKGYMRRGQRRRR